MWRWNYGHQYNCTHGPTADAASAADDDVGFETDPVPAVTAPPNTGHISPFLLHTRRRVRNAKYGPYLQIRKYSGLYFAVFTVKKAKYMPPNSYLAAPKFAFDVPATC